MSDLSINKRKSAKELIGEYMDVIMDLAMTDHDEPENSEIILSLESKRDSLQLKMKDKVQSIDFFSQNIKERDYLLSAEIEAHKDEIERLRNRQKALNATSDYLNKILLPLIIEEIGDENGVLETDTARYKLYETYGSVIITDQEALSKEFIKTEIVQKVDKAKLRKVCMRSVKDGYELPTGASITKVKRVKRS
tara:strand:+ start:17 stop:598 length:582 start_codon:yes stop_codon:yes gene_type:complete